MRDMDGLLKDNNEPPDVLWHNRYKDLPQFEKVPFSQFKSRLDSYRKSKPAQGWIKWESSPASRVMLLDFEEDGYLRNNKGDAESLWEDRYQHLSQFSDVPFLQFQSMLHQYRSQKNPGWINWRFCKARQVLLEDFEAGGFLYENLTPPRELWDTRYSGMSQFSNVVYSQFESQLRSYRKKSDASRARSTFEEEALAHDRKLFPRKPRNRRGEVVFDLSDAKELLKQDVADKIHLKKTPMELQATRKEYAPFGARKFKERIYQAVKREKFINYLMLDREAKKTGMKVTKVLKKKEEEAAKLGMTVADLLAAEEQAATQHDKSRDQDYAVGEHAARQDDNGSMPFAAATQDMNTDEDNDSMDIEFD